MKKIECIFSKKILILIIFTLIIFIAYKTNSYTKFINQKNIILVNTQNRVKNLKSEKTIKSEPTTKSEETKIARDSNGAYNVSGTIIVNKKYGLDKNYTYKNNQEIFDEATDAFNKMQKDAQNQGLNLFVISRYRSYSLQKWLYSKYKLECKNVDTFSAKPGYSEHQTGMAFDLNNTKTSVQERFEFTKEYQWLSENAHKYGFILRYPKHKTHITGYKFEPWHYRYVGKSLSVKIKEKNITLEEYFNIS